MINAVSSSAFPGSSGPSLAGLQAQLERCQKQLSDQVNCSSANTHAGKEKIQELSGKVGEIKARIEKATENTAGHGNSGRSGTALNTPAVSVFATVGVRLDVLA